MTKTKAKREPTYLLDRVLPPTDVTADGFLAKHRSSLDILKRQSYEMTIKTKWR
jgi:hypothetical protein